jgi:archaellum biogenesis protein FlaJ (TadC family)
MNKKKLIALAIVVFIVLLPFRAAYITFSLETQFLQVISMTVLIIGAIVAIMMYNQGSEEEAHH